MDVAGLARCQEQREEPAVVVGERAHLGRASSARVADRPVLLPPCAPAAQRCARTVVLSTVPSADATSSHEKPGYGDEVVT